METTEKQLVQFELPQLQFNEYDLEPHISQKTMRVHYGKHHKGYVDKLNKAIEEQGIPEMDIEEILSEVSKYGNAIRNNGGGHYNHALFWRIISPEKTEPTGKLKDKIEEIFESIPKFKQQFKQAATRQFGSGWAWLVFTDSNQLEIGATPNQDNPLMDDASLKGYPLMGLDVWEHAYYLDYQNKRGDYVDSFWDIVNWNEVGKRYDEAIQKTS